MSQVMKKRPSLEISGISMIYATAAMGGLSLFLGVFKLPGVNWETILPISTIIVDSIGSIASLFILATSVCLYLLKNWARFVVIGVQVVIGILLPLGFDPKNILPKVDVEFVILARGITVLASILIVAYLTVGKGSRLFVNEDETIAKGECYCPLCLDRFETPVVDCPVCGVPALQSFNAEDNVSFSSRVTEVS